MTEPELTWEQLLAAYADRELDPAARRRVEEHVRHNPEAKADLGNQHALSPRNDRLWNVVEPPLPSEARWKDVRAGIERRLEPNVEPGRPKQRNRWLKRGLLLAALVVTGSTAAAVIVAAIPPRRTLPPAFPTLPAIIDDEEVLAITQSDDVDIVSIRHADSQQLVVGLPPFRETLKLAAAGDVTLDSIQPGEDGVMPQVHMWGADAPMILAPPRDP